jgi:hypothetical protein
MDVIKPDILIPYQIDTTCDMPLMVIYVRPKTNRINYERAILLGVQPYADIKYMANLNGKLFITRSLVTEHYATQYKFSIYGKREIARYPDMIEKFEKHFNVPFEKAPVMGAFDALITMKIPAEELFNVIVPEKDFLYLYGQTIKKIDQYYIVNYNIPALIEKYRPGANIFVVLARSKEKGFVHKKVNQSIFNSLKKDDSTPIIDGNKLQMLSWESQVRRTYHISLNHLCCMFDMLDFIYHPDGETIEPAQIPLAHKLFEDGIITEEQLLRIKKYSIVYIRQNGTRRLINILDEASNMDFNQVANLLSSIDWSDHDSDNSLPDSV